MSDAELATNKAKRKKELLETLNKPANTKAGRDGQN